MNEPLLALQTSAYDYSLPQEQIASRAVEPADSAKLLVYERATQRIIHTHFREILSFIPPSCAIFLNDTKVIKARIFGKKAPIKSSKTGELQGRGKVELLFNKPLGAYQFLVMIRGRVHEGTTLLFDEGLSAKVLACQEDGSRVVSFEQNSTPLRFEELVPILDKIGHVPLPPYIQREDTKEDEKTYQTLFAKEAGAVAAPTASLHFTPELLAKLKATHPTYTLTLHVGSGTFKPVESEHILDHPMHSEVFHIPKDSQEALQKEHPILAVGTTVTRTIEYYQRTQKTEGSCDLFLHPHNPPQKVTHLLTNFHLPKSTLIMLVASFIGREKTLELYDEAIAKGYRFFSYGDAMLII